MVNDGGPCIIQEQGDLGLGITPYDENETSETVNTDDENREKQK